MTVRVISVRTAVLVSMLSMRTAASVPPTTLVTSAKVTWMNVRPVRPYARMEPPARIRTAVTRAYALMDGPVPIVASTLTIARTRPVSTVQLARMAWVVSIANARPAKQVCFVTWTMLVRQIHAMRMPFAIRVQSMDLSRVRVLPATRASIAPRILTNVSRDRRVNTMAFA